MDNRTKYLSVILAVVLLAFAFDLISFKHEARFSVFSNISKMMQGNFSTVRIAVLPSSKLVSTSTTSIASTTKPLLSTLPPESPLNYVDNKNGQLQIIIQV